MKQDQLTYKRLLQDLYTQSNDNSTLTNSLIQTFLEKDSFEISIREVLSRYAQYRHPLVKSNWEKKKVERGLVRVRELCDKYQLLYPHIDMKETYLLLCKDIEPLPPEYEGLESVFNCGMQYLATGQVAYWAPTIQEIDKAKELVYRNYREYYEGLLKLE